MKIKHLPLFLGHSEVSFAMFTSSSFTSLTFKHCCITSSMISVLGEASVTISVAATGGDVVVASISTSVVISSVITSVAVTGAEVDPVSVTISSTSVVVAASESGMTYSVVVGISCSSVVALSVVSSSLGTFGLSSVVVFSSRAGVVVSMKSTIVVKVVISFSGSSV